MRTCKCGCGAGLQKFKLYAPGHATSQKNLESAKARSSAIREGRRSRASEINNLLRSGATLTEVGARFGISRQRVEQIIRPLKASARNKLTIALENGVMCRPERCSECDMQGKIQAHHDDYAKPLEVRWLCGPCHAEADIARRRGLTVARIHNPAEDTFSTKEAARYLGLGYQAFARYANRRRVRITWGEGRARYFRRADLDRFRAEQRSARPPRLTCKYGHKRTPENIDSYGHCRACQANHQAEFHGRKRKAMSTYAARIVFTECGYVIDRTTSHALTAHLAGVAVSISRWGGNPWEVRIDSPTECVSYRVRTIGKLARVLKTAAAGWVRDCLLCVVSGSAGSKSDPIVAAHVKGRGAGGDSRDLVPMLASLHDELHTIGQDTFAAKYKVDLEKAADIIEGRWQEFAK